MNPDVACRRGSKIVVAANVAIAIVLLVVMGFFIDPRTTAIFLLVVLATLVLVVAEYGWWLIGREIFLPNHHRCRRQGSSK
jgi:hypothetical protein